MSTPMLLLTQALPNRLSALTQGCCPRSGTRWNIAAKPELQVTWQVGHVELRARPDIHQGRPLSLQTPLQLCRGHPACGAAGQRFSTARTQCRGMHTMPAAEHITEAPIWEVASACVSPAPQHLLVSECGHRVGCDVHTTWADSTV